MICFEIYNNTISVNVVFKFKIHNKNYNYTNAKTRFHPTVLGASFSQLNLLYCKLNAPVVVSCRRLLTFFFLNLPQRNELIVTVRSENTK